MAKDDDWGSLLQSHPIFSLPESVLDDEDSLELSLNTLPKFIHTKSARENPAPSGRRQIMCMKDADLILAAGSELRMTSLGDAKLSGGSQKTYKALHTPNIEFDIHQITLNPNGKLLAVAGAFQVAVVVLPRGGFSKLVTSRVDCRSIQIGQYYHATDSSPPIAKIEWHPWGEAGSTLLVMSIDGKLREYDISVDPEEPQQTLSFVPERKRGAYAAEDISEREVASFMLGRGKADWGPLTIYAVMKSGDIYAICPYIVQNASVPSSYVHALECYVAAKQEFLSDEDRTADESFTALYEYQGKYVNGLMKQLPPGTVFPSTSRSIPMHPPPAIKSQPLRQGPFLLQPCPPDLEGSAGGEASDIAYVAFGSGFDEDDSAADSLVAERLGIVMVTFQDGRVDVCLDLEKVEARWESMQSSTSALPMLAVYETVDLGIISSLSRISLSANDRSIAELIQANYPVFHLDPIHDDTIYVYHAFGVHALNLGPVLQNLALALKEEEDDEFTSVVQRSISTSVQPILSTLSVERKSSNSIVAVNVPNDVYLTYSIFILTSTMRIISFALNLQTDFPEASFPEASQRVRLALPPIPDGSSAYLSLLQARPFVMPAVLSRPSGLPSNPRLSLPSPRNIKSELQVTPDILRYLGSVVERFTAEIRDVQLAYRELVRRTELQRQEYDRQHEKCREMISIIEDIKGRRSRECQTRVKKVQDEQGLLLSRMDRVLQALINHASPELNEHETKWFEELRRMKSQIVGTGRYDQTSLLVRLQLLRKEFDRLLPSLNELAAKEKERKARLSESSNNFGFSESFSYGKRSEAERVKLEEAVKEIVKLAERLEITSLGKAPLPAKERNNNDGY